MFRPSPRFSSSSTFSSRTNNSVRTSVILNLPKPKPFFLLLLNPISQQRKLLTRKNVPTPPRSKFSVLWLFAQIPFLLPSRFFSNAVAQSNEIDSIFRTPDTQESGGYEPIEEIIPLIKEGKDLLELKRFSDAEAQFSEALKVNSKEPSANMGKGIALLEMKKFKDAMVYFEIAMQNIDVLTHPLAVFHTLSRLGECQFEIGDSNAALNSFQRALDILYKQAESPKNNREKDFLHQSIANIQFLKAKVHNKLKQPEKEVQCYEEQIRLFSNEVAPYANKGSAHLELNQLEEALGCFEIATKLKPDLWLLLYLKGRTLFRLRQYKPALEVLERTLELNPKHVKAQKMVEYIRDHLKIT